MKTQPYFVILTLATLFAPAVEAMQSVTKPSEAKQTYLLELKAAEDLAKVALERAKTTEIARDRVIDLSPPTEKEQLLAADVAELEKTLAEKELIADANILSMLTARRVELLIDVAGLASRQVLELKLRSEQRSLEKEKGQPAIEAGRRYVELAIKKRDQLATLSAQGSVPQMQLEEAEHEVAMARLQLMQKEKELACNGAIEASAELHLALAEKKAQLATVEELLADASSVRADVKRLADLKSWLAQIKKSREYGTMETLKEYEKALAEQKLRAIGMQERLEKIKKREPN